MAPLTGGEGHGVVPGGKGGLVYIIGGVVAGVAALWTLAALAWSSSAARHFPELRDSTQQVRYGWRCSRCGRTHAPTCKVSKCRGPLVWVQRGATIKCARCHRRFIPHPFLFRLKPRPRRMFCLGCKSFSLVTDWRLS